jgi:hypothetical protein
MPKPTRKTTSTGSGIVLIIDSAAHLLPLLSPGYRVARLRRETLTLLVIAAGGKRPDWLVIPSHYDAGTIDIRLIGSASPSDEIIYFVRDKPPTILGFGLDEYKRDSRYLLNATLDPVLHRANCPTAIIKAPPDWEVRAGDGQVVDVFVPFWNDANSRYAIDLALAVDPAARVTAGFVVPPCVDEADQREREQSLKLMTEDWADEPRFSAKLLIGRDEIATLLEAAAQHELTLLGASRGPTVLRAVFGDPRHQLLGRNSGPTMILREYQGTVGALLFRALSRWQRWMPILTMDERIDVYRQVRRGARPRQDFFMMIGLSAGIAALGLKAIWISISASYRAARTPSCWRF